MEQFTGDKKHIEDSNVKLNERLKIKNNSDIVSTPEFYSIKISENLVEDANTIHFLRTNNFSNRYVDSIIKSMAEQVIEYKYIINKYIVYEEHEALNMYFGKYIPIHTATEEEDKNINRDISIRELLEKMEKNNGERYENNARMSLGFMDDENKEIDNQNVYISLYDIFRYEEKMEHDAYFNSIVEKDNLLQDKIEPGLKKDLASMFLDCIFKSFLKTYNQVLRYNN